MYLSALHVIQLQTGAEGINAYCYLHFRDDWLVVPDPNVDPGELANAHLPIQPPGGNRVRSYLDIVAPDGAPWTEIRQRLMTFLLDHHHQPFPWDGAGGLCLFRTSMEYALAPYWQNEITALYEALRAVRGNL